jgi:phospholipase/carboxylesterase
MTSLVHRERPAAGRPEGLLVLHHGRGTDEHDLTALGDALDPGRRLHVVTPRAPLPFPGVGGYRWYETPRVGYPDPATFHSSYARLAELHDELWTRTGLGPAQTVLGGFSMGTVMSYALGLGSDRPAPGGILAFSGFVPAVEGWEPSLDDRTGTHVFIAHGRGDPVIGVEFARRARELLDAAGFEVDYRESDAVHTIDPHDIPRAVAWLARTIAPATIE